MTAIAMKTKNRMREMPPAAEETPEKPRPPAMIEITKAISAYFRRVIVVFQAHR